MILDLDDPGCSNPSIAGAKAAGLARARQVGLPVLPGVVLTTGASRTAMARGSLALQTRGSGGARTVIACRPLDRRLHDGLASAVAVLGEPLIVRSSSPMEGDGAWSGAFTSYQAIGVADLDVAVRGCWASAFGPAALARMEAAGLGAGAAEMAVLVQPSVEPAFGGVARLAGGVVIIHAVRGSPAPIVQGHEAGVTIRVASDGLADGAGGVGLLGATAARDVANVLLEAHAKLGATACEWAILANGSVLLLQTSTAAQPPERAPLLVPDALRGAAAAGLARLVRRSPGPLGEALVLPWAVALHADEPGAHDEADPRGAGDLDPLAALRAARAAAADLAGAAWGLPPDVALRSAAHALREARGPDPGPALAGLAVLRAPDGHAVDRQHALLARARAGLVDAGEVPDADTAWYVEPSRAESVLAGLVRPGRSRIGVDRWEPFTSAVVLATGSATTGMPAAPGVGSGRLRYIADPGGDTGTRPRQVIVVQRPIPSLGALLWDAAGLIALGGGPAAHLFEAARSVGVPAICGADLAPILGEPLELADGRYVVAMDGESGVVSIMPW